MPMLRACRDTFHWKSLGWKELLGLPVSMYIFIIVFHNSFRVVLYCADMVPLLFSFYV